MVFVWRDYCFASEDLTGMEYNTTDGRARNTANMKTKMIVEEGHHGTPVIRNTINKKIKLELI